MAFTVREVQPTPNPNAAKFMLDKEIASAPTSFFQASQAQDHPLATKKTLRLQDLATEAWVQGCPSTSCGLMHMRACQNAGISLAARTRNASLSEGRFSFSRNAP